jgi:glycosyltransferase involved in cell wall biosynthesis
MEDARPAFVIPVYNHGMRVGGVVQKALRMGAPVYVVDDGSDDFNPGVLDSISGATILRHSENMGKGAALLTGFAEAAKSSKWAVTLDADGQHNPEEAVRLLEAVPRGQRPLVVGRRRGMNHPNVPQTSALGRSFSNFWVWLSGGIRLPDTQCGFRLYPLPEVLHMGAKSRRYQFEVEILVLAAWRRMPVIDVDVNVEYQPRHERVSHFKAGPDFWRNTKTFARLTAERILLPRAYRVRKYMEK